MKYDLFHAGDAMDESAAPNTCGNQWEAMCCDSKSSVCLCLALSPSFVHAFILPLLLYSIYQVLEANVCQYYRACSTRVNHLHRPKKKAEGVHEETEAELMNDIMS